MSPAFVLRAVPCLALGALALASVACTSATPLDAVACVERPATYPLDTELPYVAGQDTTAAPNCEPTCGVERVDGYFPVAAVPLGACNFAEGYACDMPARGPCPQEQVGQAVNGVRCRCQGGEWSCALISQGGAVGCIPGLDGGVDAALLAP